ncbi:MAG TPA: UDP-3-O-[3-hydroxymyristoyl] N-acetylglucosamine deacetylase, partial [bacterium]|nr:UDP-3-O-[3-hydroxymyristoyl] N-acetylglucosamine deacetylase [bacterium]
MKRQSTLKTSAVIRGTGLHKGRMNTVVFVPAPEGQGIKIRNKGEFYGLNPACIKDTRRGTTIKHGKSVIHTVEHMLAAVKG